MARSPCRVSSGEVAALESPKPEISDLLIIEFRVADMAITRDQHNMGTLNPGLAVPAAHEWLTLVLDPIPLFPMPLVVFAHDQQGMDLPEPIRIGLLEIIEIFLTGQSRALGILLQDLLVDEVLVIAERGLHLRTHPGGPSQIFLCTAPRTKVFRVLVTRGLEEFRIAARNMIDLVDFYFLGAGPFPPLVPPTVRAAGAESKQANVTGLFDEAVHVRLHRPGGRVAPAEDLLARQMLIDQGGEALTDDVEGA